MTQSSIDLAPHLLQAAQGFINLVNNPSQTEAVFDLADGLRPTDLYQQFIDYAYAQPEVAAIVQGRYKPPAIDLEQLLTYPTDSLGYGYASTLKAMNLDPNFYRQIPIEDDYSYLAIRMRQTHDIWHLITGFGTDLAGEMGLQAFTLAQTHSPLSVTILAATLLHTLKMNGPLNQVVESLQRGWQMGLQAKPFLAQTWEAGWEKSIADWRSELKLLPLTST
ncbi:Coq4 family protein [Alkalinema pantanalense]|uniref:Coq4 family protein n=1 Tax=Alkalinema pantanalense TaxID=1620705 RepID=UPI003D700761